MLKPRKQRKRVPITLEQGLLSALKGKLMRFDVLHSENSDRRYSAYFTSDCSDYVAQKRFLSVENRDCFTSFERLVNRLEEKNVLIYAPYECSTWVIAGDKVAIAMLKASRPRAIGQSRLKREKKDHSLCSDEELIAFRAYMDGLDGFHYRGETERNNPHQASKVKSEAWLERWHEGHQNENPITHT